MKIKKSSIDIFLVILIMFVTILPTLIAKQLVIASLSLLVVRIIVSNDLFSYLNYKIIIFTLFIPGILGAIFVAPEHLVRFLGILLIILGFPFSSFKIKHSSIILMASFILLYLIIAQLLILKGNEMIINFRDLAYDFELSDVHRSYGTTENILMNAFDFSYWAIRAGGLYSNPNTLAGVVIMYFFIFDISWKYNEQIISYDKKKRNKILFYWVIFFLVFISLMTTKSKTFLIAFLAYLVFQHFNLINSIRLKIKKKLILPIIFGVGILSIFYEKILEGIFLQGGSANIKYSILFDYLNYASLMDLLFGGTYNIFFDTEYGYWIGATGLFGVTAFLIFYKLLYQVAPQSKALLMSFLLMSFGSTLFYNLLLVSIIIPLFIILLSFKKNFNEQLN